MIEPRANPEPNAKEVAPCATETGGWNLGNPGPEELSRTRHDLRRFLGGEEAAFGVIWERFRPALEVHLRARARRRLGDTRLRARFDAEFEDLLQDVAVTVFRRLHAFEYREAGSLLAWMCGIATNQLNDWLDHWTAGRRTPRIEKSFGEGRPGLVHALGSLSSAVVSPAVGPSTAAERAERRRKVADALGELPERYQQIVLLRIFAESSWADIAREVGAPSADAVRMEFAGKVLPAVRNALAGSDRAES